MKNIKLRKNKLSNAEVKAVVAKTRSVFAGYAEANSVVLAAKSKDSQETLRCILALPAATLTEAETKQKLVSIIADFDDERAAAEKEAQAKSEALELEQQENAKKLEAEYKAQKEAEEKAAKEKAEQDAATKEAERQAEILMNEKESEARAAVNEPTKEGAEEEPAVDAETEATKNEIAEKEAKEAAEAEANDKVEEEVESEKALKIKSLENVKTKTRKFLNEVLEIEKDQVEIIVSDIEKPFLVTEEQVAKLDKAPFEFELSLTYNSNSSL